MPFVVFITGACVLVVEVVATRVLSPFYGNTIFTVSSVISVILAALSIGYYYGGKLADKYPSMVWFFGIILASGLFLLSFHFLGIVILPVLGAQLSLSLGPLISSLILFFLPAVLLGMLSPYAVKIQSVNFPEQGIGTIAGKMFFWSTLGSIAGSLSAGFFLIPMFGVNEIITSTGVILFLLGFVFLASLTKEKLLIRAFIFILLLVPISFLAFEDKREGLLYEKDGIYEKIAIFDKQLNGVKIRYFQQDRSSSGAMFIDSDDPKDLVYEYTKYYSIFKIFKPKLENALVIGGGAYSVPKALLAESGDISVDVSEIEPSLFDLAKKYFRVQDSKRLNNFTEDGRRLLKDSEKKYDLIFSDVYYSLYSIPSHFTTKEFFEIAKEKLSEDGIFMANIIGGLSRQEPSFMMSEIKTFESIFENSYFFAARSPKENSAQNIIFVGYNSSKKIDFNSPEILEESNPLIRSLKDKLVDINRFDLSLYPVLTDNYSPVEYLVGRALLKSENKTGVFSGQEILSVIIQQLRYGYRYPTAEGHKKTKDFLIAEMQVLSDQVKIQNWEHKEKNQDSYELTNIIARFFPEKQKRIILATHYDSQKISFKNILNQSQPSPGANNSASGTAILVEFARALSNSGIKPNVGVDIIFFDGEEGEESQGADFTNWKPLGSTYFTEHLSETYKEKPVLGIVLDMVCDKDLKIYKEASSVRNAEEQTNAFFNIAKKYSNAFTDEVYQEIKDDHTLLNQAGIPSFLVIDYEYPYYATTNDTIDKCSKKSLETVAEALYEYIFTIQ